VSHRTDAKTDPRTQLAGPPIGWRQAWTAFRAAASRQNRPPVQNQRQRQLSQLQQDIRSSWRWFLHRPQQTNWKLSEMVPERCLTLTAGTKASELGVQWPDIPRGKFLNASAERSNCFPFRPNDVTIRRQGTKAPVKTLESKRPSLAVNYMAHVADSQRFLLK